MIETNDITGLRRVIDFSGDSANNRAGPPVAPARAEVLAAGITINALALYCGAVPAPRAVATWPSATATKSSAAPAPSWWRWKRPISSSKPWCASWFWKSRRWSQRLTKP